MELLAEYAFSNVPVDYSDMSDKELEDKIEGYLDETFEKWEYGDYKGYVSSVTSSDEMSLLNIWKAARLNTAVYSFQIYEYSCTSGYSDSCTINIIEGEDGNYRAICFEYSNVVSEEPVYIFEADEEYAVELYKHLLTQQSGDFEGDVDIETIEDILYFEGIIK